MRIYNIDIFTYSKSLHMFIEGKGGDLIVTKLAYLRKKKGLTQDEMAKMLAIGLSTYNQYENLQRSIPIQIAEKIASILDVPVDEIFLPIKFTVSKTRVKRGNKKHEGDIAKN